MVARPDADRAGRAGVLGGGGLPQPRRPVAGAALTGRLNRRPTLTVERIDDGEVSPYLVDEVRAGDEFELRGPVGGHFAWRVQDGGPLLLVAGGSGLVPLMAMLRHLAPHDEGIDVRLLVSARGWDDVLYREELATLARR